jgi:hypothetical protein
MKKITILCAISIAAASAQAVAGYISPATGNFDLRQWKITLPTADKSGGAAEIIPDEIMAGYASKYFYLDDKGKMTFWAPVNGSIATTDNSTYPRSELREIIGDNQRDDWNWEGHHTLSGCLWVSQTSISKKVIVGQIHSYNQPLVKLQWNNGSVIAQIKRKENGKNGEITTKLATPGSSQFCYTIDSNAGVITVKVKGGGTATYDYIGTDPNWKKQKFYFKAGAYCQEHVGTDPDANAGCKIRFSSLTSAH